MSFISKPVRLSHEEVEKYKTDDKNGLAICKCPITIYSPDGSVNAHVVEYDKIYVCSDCNTMILLHNIGHNNEQLFSLSKKKGDM